MQRRNMERQKVNKDEKEVNDGDKEVNVNTMEKTRKKIEIYFDTNNNKNNIDESIKLHSHLLMEFES